MVCLPDLDDEVLKGAVNGQRMVLWVLQHL